MTTLSALSLTPGDFIGSMLTTDENARDGLDVLKVVRVTLDEGDRVTLIAVDSLDVGGSTYTRTYVGAGARLFTVDPVDVDPRAVFPSLTLGI